MLKRLGTHRFNLRFWCLFSVDVTVSLSLLARWHAVIWWMWSTDDTTHGECSCCCSNRLQNRSVMSSVQFQVPVLNFQGALCKQGQCIGGRVFQRSADRRSVFLKWLLFSSLVIHFLLAHHHRHHHPFPLCHLTSLQQVDQSPQPSSPHDWAKVSDVWLDHLPEADHTYHPLSHLHHHHDENGQHCRGRCRRCQRQWWY